VAIASFGIAVVVFDTVWQALLPPFLFLVVATVEGQIVTPMIVGQRHSLNAVVILISIAFWGWIWGIIGALIAVPLLVTAKVFADYVDGFRPVGEFLSARDLPEPAEPEPAAEGSSGK
jgi:predicted PurR-regulated permease PerM